MSDAGLTKRKAYLLNQIQQQRLDLSAAKRDWLQLTGPYDRGWNTLLSLRSYAMIASSVLAIWTVKHPGRFMRWAKRGIGAWSTWRLIRNSLNPPSR